MSTTPAESLDGMDLRNGWKVIGKITRKKISTGGHFSIGYKVINTDGKEAFLKALDFSVAAQQADFARVLQGMLEAYNYERDLLVKCKDRKLRRVMTPIIDGSISVPGFGIFSPVFYLIFPLANGDIRDVLDDFKAFDLVWCLRSLHHVAIGIQQLHSISVAHQDIKPSNVLFTGEDGSIISDLGRATDQNRPSPHDHCLVAGARGYAPLDLYYKDTGVVGFDKRLLTDLYLLGSLVFFHFAGVSAAQALRTKLRGTILGNTSFKQDLPYLQHAFEECVDDLRTNIAKLAGTLTEEIILVVKQLCDPDPTKRGDPRWKGSIVSSSDLQTFISRFDHLCRKAEIVLL